MGSRSSSSQATHFTDSRAVLGEGALQTNGNRDVIIQQTADGAFEVVGGAIDANVAVIGKTLDFVDGFATESQAQQATALNLIKDAYADAKGRGALVDQIFMITAIGLVLVAYFAVKK